MGLRSVQYLAIRYTDRLLEAGIDSSVGSRGDASDNALAESINALYKAEVIYHEGPWKGLEDVGYATLAWVAWYNGQRLMEPLGFVPPAAARGTAPPAAAPCPGRPIGRGAHLTESPENPGRFVGATVRIPVGAP
jgi:transposase InsO family protein